jgi:hypothetical protein
MQLTLDHRPALQGDSSQLRTRLVIGIALVAAALAGLAVGVNPALAAIPVAIAVPVIIWRRPHYAIVILVASGTLIENFKEPVGTHSGTWTEDIPWWRSLNHGTIVFPVEIFLFVVILIWILLAGLNGSFGLPKTPVTRALKVFWLLIVIGIGVGMTHGAKLKYNLWETRSWIYLTLGFLLAAAFLRTRKSLDAILWTLVIGTGFKGLQGTEIFFSYARAMHPRPEAILGHEEAFFMGLFITITAALWLYGFKGPLRTTATCLLPFVVIADMANARRAAWLIIGLGLFVLFGITLKTLPNRRKFLTRALVALTIVSAVYIPAYWNHDGTLAQPARAVRSQIQPNSRDESSDLYRLLEDYNLISNIKGSGLLGAGFGVPIQYSGITNISDVDPMIAYIPHNGLLWVWLRMGLQGEIAFWCLAGVALVRACRLAKVADPRLAMFGTVVAAAIVGYLADGYEDMGLAEFRIALVMGCLLGLAEAGLRLAASRDGAEDTDGSRRPLGLVAARKPVLLRGGHDD